MKILTAISSNACINKSVQESFLLLSHDVWPLFTHPRCFLDLGMSNCMIFPGSLQKQCCSVLWQGGCSSGAVSTMRWHNPKAALIYSTFWVEVLLSFPLYQEI